MKHEKLRSSTASHGELGLLEYISGKRGQACDLLVKTINSTSKLLKSEAEESEDVDLNSKWETISEVTKLYRTVAELHFREEPTVALNTLVCLGNNFDTISVQSPDTEKILQPKSTSILKAKRLFESIMSMLVPLAQLDEVEREGKDNPVKCDVESDEMSWLHKWEGEHAIEYLVQKVNLIVEWTVAYALFQYLSDGFESACEVYKRVMDRIGIPEPLSRTSQYKSLLVK